MTSTLHHSPKEKGTRKFLDPTVCNGFDKSITCGRSAAIPLGHTKICCLRICYMEEVPLIHSVTSFLFYMFLTHGGPDLKPASW